MAELNMAKAKETYEVLCKMLDNKKWHYDKIEDDLVIKSGVKGDDLPIDFIMRVNPRNEIVSFFSWMPYKVDESKRIDLALAVCTANYGLADGSFDYNLSDGTILFRLTSSYKESTLSEELFEYMLMVAASTVDIYNDKFFMISKGMLTVQQFIESEQSSK
ncbi:MAG: YbjN domain-containing protein [Clostridia bacterium]|nr:YbjN domain-containing protein [Clostridia bacterium]